MQWEINTALTSLRCRHAPTIFWELGERRNCVHMCVCSHAYIYTYVCALMFVYSYSCVHSQPYVHPYVYTSIIVCRHMSAYASMLVCVCTHAVWIHTCVCTHSYVYLCVCASMCMCASMLVCIHLCVGTCLSIPCVSLCVASHSMSASIHKHGLQSLHRSRDCMWQRGFGCFIECKRELLGWKIPSANRIPCSLKVVNTN